MEIGFVIVAYANVEVVRATVGEVMRQLKPFDLPLYVVDNHSPDEQTRVYLDELSYKYFGDVFILNPGRNIGCHNGFAFGFDAILKDHSPTLLVKCDDDTVPPRKIDYSAVLSLFNAMPRLAMLGTNFFDDGRLDAASCNYISHDAYCTRYVSWKGQVINLPFGFLRTEFYNQAGLHVDYHTANGEVITEDSHLYGGEEAYLSRKAIELGYDYGYLKDAKATFVANELLDPDYMLWKYVFGFLGTYKYDFSIFKQDEAAKAEGYRYWQTHSSNGMHQQWSAEYFHDHFSDAG